MLAKFVHWYNKKYFGDDYYLRSELQGVFDNIRKDEAKINKDFYDHEMETLEKRLTRQQFLEVMELKNIIEAKEVEVSFYKSRQNDVDDLEFHVTKKAQECVAQVTGVSIKINTIRDMFANHSGTLEKSRKDLEDVYLELGLPVHKDQGER
jgi:hypothetical protein